MSQKNNSRKVLLAVAAVFLAPMLISMLLNHFEWLPQAKRNFGELVTPPVDVSEVQLQTDAGAWPWQGEDDAWTVIVRPTVPCAQSCVERLDEIRRVRLALGRHAPRVRLMTQVGSVDEETLAALSPMQVSELPNEHFAIPDKDIAVYVVNSHGFIVLRYAPEFNASGLRKDLARLIK